VNTKVMKNNSIEGFRGVLICWIALFHYTFRYNSLFSTHTINIPFVFQNAIVGVSIFFLLSGFFFAKSLLRIYENSTISYTAKTIINKYWRLWYPYVLAIVLIYGISLLFPLPSRHVSLNTFLINLLFIVHPGVPYVDGSHWFISTLFVFQIIFLLLAYLFKKSYKTVLVFISIIILLTLIPHHFQKIFINNILSYKLLSFSIGLLLFFGKEKNNKILLLAFLTFLLLIYKFHNIWFFVYFIMTLIFIYNLIPLFAKIFSSKIMLFIGSNSFMWYLIHQNIGYTIIYYLRDIFNHTFLIILSLLFTFLLSVFINKCLQRCPSILFKL